MLSEFVFRRLQNVILVGHVEVLAAYIAFHIEVYVIMLKAVFGLDSIGETHAAIVTELVIIRISVSE